MVSCGAQQYNRLMAGGEGNDCIARYGRNDILTEGRGRPPIRGDRIVGRLSLPQHLKRARSTVTVQGLWTMGKAPKSARGL